MNKRKKLVADHAKALFLERGILQTSIQDIIERAGISKGTFYNYFTSKNECVAAVLQKSRDDINLNRTEMQLGKDPADLNILISQIVLMSQRNAQQGMSGIFEEIMHSGDTELKRIVMNYRLLEIEWLTGRLIDVYGKSLEPYAVEAAVLFYGMYQHLMFTAKLINQSRSTTEQITKSVFHHMSSIINSLVNEGVAVLEKDKLFLLQSNMSQKMIKREDVIRLFAELIEHNQLTQLQLELTEALKQEMEREELRHSIIQALLAPFLESYRTTLLYVEAKDVMGKTWSYLKQQHS